MSRRSAALPALAALLVAASPPLASAAVKARAHLRTAGEQDCADCHRTQTPEVFTAWEGSPHGVALVKCVVCHGSTGKDFKARPAATGCVSCHAAQAASLAKRPVTDCFACHAPHTLSAHPHR